MKLGTGVVQHGSLTPLNRHGDKNFDQMMEKIENTTQHGGKARELGSQTLSLTPRLLKQLHLYLGGHSATRIWQWGPVQIRTFHKRRTSSYTAHANTCRSCKYARKCGKRMKEGYPPNCDHLILQGYPIKQPFGISPGLTSGLTFARFYSKVPKVRCHAGRQRRILGGLPSSG